MIKILYMNLLDNNYGQKRMDENIIKELSNIGDTYIICPQNWYTNLPDNIHNSSYDLIMQNNNSKIYYYIKNLRSLVLFLRENLRIHFDYLFFASYETYVFAMAIPFIRDISNKVYIIHNNNLDLIGESSKKRLFFKMYMHKVNHVVLEEFIGKYIIDEFGISEKKVYYLPHPLNHIERMKVKKYDCVGISNSNNEEWILEIIKYEMQDNIFKTMDMQVVLRSKNMKYDNGFLHVINGYLSDEEYYDYILQAKEVFLPFPDSFKYRMSGSIVDAFSNNIAVIGSKIPLFEYFAQKYPNICMTISSSTEFVNAIMELGKKSINAKYNFDDFRTCHSQKNISEALQMMFIY